MELNELRTIKFSSSFYPLPGPIKWTALVKAVQDEFTLNGLIPVVDQFDGSALDTNLGMNNWTIELIEDTIKKARAGTLETYYPGAVRDHENAIASYPLTGKNVLVIGSITPWLEALALKNGANEPVTTIDFSPINCASPKILTYTIDEFRALEYRQFDAILSFSSLEHDGLGRWGDPLNPNGDIERIQEIMNLIKPGGKFYLGFPVGNDKLVFNLHRIYGRVRLPKIIRGWDLLGVFENGSRYKETLLNYDIFDNAFNNYIQPVLVLRRPIVPHTPERLAEETVQFAPE